MVARSLALRTPPLPPDLIVFDRFGFRKDTRKEKTFGHIKNRSPRSERVIQQTNVCTLGLPGTPRTLVALGGGDLQLRVCASRNCADRRPGVAIAGFKPVGFAE